MGDGFGSGDLNADKYGSFLDPRRPFQQYAALTMMSLIGLGTYFSYDNPGALQDHMKMNLNLSNVNIGILYTIYSLPNAVLCFFSVSIIKSLHIRAAASIYIAILAFGSVVFAYAVYANTFWLMILGRGIFGIGAESLAVTQNFFAAGWFRSNRLNWAFTLKLTLARASSALSFLVMEPLYKSTRADLPESQRIGIAMFYGSVSCLVSLVCLLVLIWMDWRAEKLHLHPESLQIEPITFNMRVIKEFNCLFWFVAIICVAYYVAVTPFISFGKVFFKSKYGVSAEEANGLCSVITVLSIVGGPLMETIRDKTGKHLTWVTAGIVTTFVAHSLITFTFVSPYIGMVLMSIGYIMLASTLWAMVDMTSPEPLSGTAYGLCQSLQNLALGIAFLISGVIIDRLGYMMLQLFFLGWLSVALVSVVLLWGFNETTKGVLNMTPEERENYVPEEMEDENHLVESDEDQSPPIEASDEVPPVFNQNDSLTETPSSTPYNYDYLYD